MEAAHTLTLADFIEREGLTFTAERAESNPNMDDMPHGSTHWRTTFTKEEATMVVYFSQGPAITRDPSAEDVLDCIASDSASYADARSFDDWAEEMGYFPMERAADYSRARSTWEAIETQEGQLRDLLGDEAMETLLWNTERL